LTWVKICGLTNLADAKTAVLAGADALGFIFTDSKRQVRPETVKEITTSLPRQIEKIGVFINQDRQEVRRIAELCNLTGLQFHGQESPQYCREFKDYTVIKAFRVNAERGWDEILAYTQLNVVDRILLDTYVPGLPGGTGKTFPWTVVTNRKNWGNIPWIIAGGINSENVSRAIVEARPFGVDVGSGVEKEPGKKDEQKVKQLICTVRKTEVDSR